MPLSAEARAPRHGGARRSSTARSTPASCRPRRARGRAGSATSATSAARTRRCASQQQGPSAHRRAARAERVGRDGARRRGRAGAHPHVARRDARGRGGGRHRQDDRAGRAASSTCWPRGAAPCRRVVGAHVHREGGRRAEAAPARRARGGARARGRRQRARARLEDAIAHLEEARDQHDPRLLRRPAARAAGRGARRPAASRCWPRPRPRRSIGQRLRPLARASAGGPPEGRPARAAPALVRRRSRVDAAAAGRLACSPTGATSAAPWRRRAVRPRRRRIDDAGRARARPAPRGSRTCSNTSDSLYARALAAAGGCSDDVRTRERVQGRATTTRSRRRSSICCRGSRLPPAAAGAPREPTGGEVTRDEILAAHGELPRRADELCTARRRRPGGARSSAELRWSGRALRGAQAAPPARSTSSTCCCARAISCATTPRSAPSSRRRFTPHLRRRVPGHRPAAGRDPAAARRGRSRRCADWRDVTPGAGQALHRRRSRSSRSIGSAAPTSASTRS